MRMPKAITIRQQYKSHLATFSTHSWWVQSAALSHSLLRLAELHTVLYSRLGQC